MFLEIFFTSVLLLTVLVVNICWIGPRRAIKYYENQLKSMKYKAKIVPYKPLYIRFLDVFQRGKKKGDPLDYYQTQFSNYDIVISNIMNKPCIEIGHVDFLKDFYSFQKHYEYPKLPLIIDPIVQLFGKTMGLSEGEIWKHKRTVLNKIFTFDFVKSQVPNIVEICDRCINEMEEKASKGDDQSGKYVQCNLLHDLLTNIFSSVIFTGFLGQKTKHEIEGVEASKYLLSLIDDLSQYRLISSTVALGNWFYELEVRKIDKSINQRKKAVRQWGKKIIKAQLTNLQNQMKQKRNKIQIDNFIKAYVIYKKQNNVSDEVISETDIFNEFLGLIFAGTDTTSNFINVMLMYIAQNPEVEKELRKQIEENLKDDYSYENLKKFKYIDALQKQTIRIYGPANFLFVRQAKNDNYLNGLAIKKGTLIMVNSHGNHYSEKYFKEPIKFRPERWLNGECDNLDPFVTIGFSAGARTCIGKHLALLQSKIALIKIMKRYKKIKLGKENFKWEMKFFVYPEPFNTRLTINQEEIKVQKQ